MDLSGRIAAKFPETLATISLGVSVGMASLRAGAPSKVLSCYQHI